MPHVHKRQQLPYSSQQMYGLVNDIERYPGFLPWCSRSEIINQTDEELVGKLYIEKGPLQHAFTTRNKLSPHHQMQISLVDGPFKTLEGQWTFTDTKDGCEISFELNFEFSNRLFSIVATPIFHGIATTMVDSFCREAHNQFG